SFPGILTHMISGHSRTRIAGALPGPTLLAAPACGADAGTRGAPGDTPQVIATSYPLQWLPDPVDSTAFQVTILITTGVAPLDLELGARQMAQLEDAALTVYIKGVQPAVDEAVSPDTSFHAATAVQTIPIGGHDHGDEHAHEEGEEGHDHGVPYDPHLWLDPSRLATVATALGERLAAADPAHAQDFKDRAAATAASLTALDQEFSQGLTT